MRELAEVSGQKTTPGPGAAWRDEATDVSGAKAAPGPGAAWRDELAAAYAQGFAEGRAQATRELERRRRRLLTVLVSDSPARAELATRLARTIGWPLPAQVSAAALAERAPQDGPRMPLPPDVLADLTGPEPCLLVPDPAAPGRAAAIDRALCGWLAAIGPAVPLARAGVSLRWARQALALARSDVIAADGAPIRCDQHLSTLLILADEDLARTLHSTRLAPLARLRPAQRDRIAETLLAWLQLGQNAAEVAHRMHVHPQTVRYRLRQIQELFGDQLHDPDLRFELQVALRARRLLAGPGPR